MARFTSTSPLNIRWYGNEISGAAGATHRIPDALYDEFNAAYSGVIPGLSWVTQDEAAATNADKYDKTGGIISGAVTVTGALVAQASISTPALTATNARFKGEPWYDVRAYGAVGDGVTNDAAAIQAALDAVVASGRPGTVFLGSSSYAITSGLTMDVTFASLVGNGATITVPTSSVPVAITVGGSVVPPYVQDTQRLEGFRLAGFARGTGVGILFNQVSVDGNGPSRITVRNINVSKFSAGLKFLEHTYLLRFYSASVYDTSICIQHPAGQVDAGENISFYGSAFFNSDLALSVIPSLADFHFFGCSFDYLGQVASIQDALVTFVGCHIEGNKTLYGTNSPVYLNGNGKFVMIGGQLLQSGTGAGNNNYVVTVDNSEARAYFHAVHMYNNLTASGAFASGTGEVVVGSLIVNTGSNQPAILSVEANRLFGFEDAAILDDVFLTVDTASITSRFTGANINLSISTAEFQSGTRSLKCTKVGASGSQAKFAIAVPVRPGAHPGFRLSYKKPGAGTGTMYLLWQAALIRVNGDGVPVLAKSEDIVAGQGITFTAAAVPWTTTQSSQTPKFQPWATHIVLHVDLNAANAMDVYFDDIVITEM